MRDAILEALRQRYESHIAEAHAVIKIYLDNSVGIGEHPQHTEELDRLVDILTNATDKLSTLRDNFGVEYGEDQPLQSKGKELLKG